MRDVREKALLAGFSILEERVIDGNTFLWKQKPVETHWDLDYISMLLQKP